MLLYKKTETHDQQQENKRPTMSITLNLRYQKPDQYGSQIFIVSGKHDEEKPGYATLCSIEEKLKGLDFCTFLPVYCNEEKRYATIRFKFYKGMKLEERNLYTVTFDVKQSERAGKTYINCRISNIKLLKKALPLDHGKTLNFDIF